MLAFSIFIATSVLTVNVYAVPAGDSAVTPSASIPPIPRPSSALAPNPSSSKATPINTNAPAQGTSPISIESSLWFPSGSGCDSSKQKYIKQAYKDALILAASVEHPELVLGHRPGDKTPHDAGSAEYFGKPSEWESITQTVIGNFRRAKLPNEQNFLGDWWHGRYLAITCNDPAKAKGLAKNPPEQWGCKLGVRAYQVDPKDADKINTSPYPLINICSDTSTPFSDLETLSKQIQNIKDGLLPKDDVESLKSQGSAFLHEMYHTVAANYVGGQNAGVSQPKCVDKSLRGSKAYGAAKAKYLARNDLGGAHVVKYNNDNYVYYTLSRFMMKTFNVPYPNKPAAAWPKTPNTNDDSTDFWDAVIQNSDPVDVPDGRQLSDEELYEDGIGPEV